MRRFSGKLERELRLARLRFGAREWARYCLAAGAALFLAAVTLGQPALAPIAGAAGFAVVYLYPSYRKRELAGAIERELPLSLRSIATLLSIGLAFEDALRQGCREPALAKEIRKALREVELGATVPEALESLAARYESKALEKAMAQLGSIYEKRGDANALRKLSDEVAGEQRAAMQEYSGKLVVCSLVFIAVSAVLPALFQAYAIVGSTFMSSTITAEQALWIPVAAFPIVDVAVLAFIRLKRPFFA